MRKRTPPPFNFDTFLDTFLMRALKVAGGIALLAMLYHDVLDELGF